jgi:hypothetical protein
MTNWVTISTLASAGSTVVLAGVTLSSVRSAHRAAAAAERSVLVGIRPVLMQSRADDHEEKVIWVDDHWAKVAGGHGYADIVNGNLYLAISLRNAGPGLGVLHGWHASDRRLLSSDPHAEPSEFRRQTRDLFIPSNDVGYWHAALREADDPMYEPLCAAVKAREHFTVDLMYSDHEGGQRMISRFAMRPLGEADDGDWLASVGRHWNLDRPDPRRPP